MPVSNNKRKSNQIWFSLIWLCPTRTALRLGNACPTWTPGYHLSFHRLDVEELQASARHAGICGVLSKAYEWDLMQNIETAVTRFTKMKQQAPEISG